MTASRLLKATMVATTFVTVTALLAGLAGCGDDTDHTDAGSSPSTQPTDESLAACAATRDDVDGSSVLTAALRTNGSAIDCVYLSSGPRGDPTECPNGDQVFPRYRQTARLFPDGRVEVGEPEPAGDPC
jgi:hypothetical protein